MQAPLERAFAGGILRTATARRHLAREHAPTRDEALQNSAARPWRHPDGRNHLVALLAERSDAADEDPPFLFDLEEEIEACREIYTVAAVTEIASLRAELWGPLEG